MYVVVSIFSVLHKTIAIAFSYPFSHAAPVMVMDCTENQDCVANTDGNTVCVNNFCSGKSSAQGKIRISQW